MRKKSRSHYSQFHIFLLLICIFFNPDFCGAALHSELAQKLYKFTDYSIFCPPITAFLEKKKSFLYC